MHKTEFISRVRGCERRLYRIAHTMLRSEADCEDAVQETLLKAWAARDSLRHEEWFETWLIRILINQCKSFWRRHESRETALPENLPQPASGNHRLMDALMALDEKHRIVLELKYIEGYDIKEVALILGIPEGTVKWRLNRARTALKRELGEEERR